MLVAKCEAFVGPQGSPIGVSLKKKEKKVEERMEKEKQADGPHHPSPSWDVSQEKATLEHVGKGCCLCEPRYAATKWNGSHDNTVIYLDFCPLPLNLFQD